MLDQLINTAREFMPLIGGAILALILLIILLRRLRNTSAGRIADKLVGPVMFGGMIWSADAVWILTGREHLNLPTPLRIAMFAVLEFMLLVAMLRAKDSMERLQRPGAHGTTAWLIASLIALFGFILGLYEGGLVVAAFRPIVPIMLTKLWWDGILGDAPRKAGSFKWTPRNMLIRLGAIEEDERDVKTVNRDRLIQRMADMYYDSLYGENKKRPKLRKKLARLTLDADDAMIAEVMTRVRRTGWTTAEPLPYGPTQPGDAATEAGVTQKTKQAEAPDDAARDARLSRTPARRTKDTKQASTSGDAVDADAVTRAVNLVVTQGLSPRKAAEAVPGTSASTIERRVRKLRETQPDPVRDAAAERVNTDLNLPFLNPNPPVTHGVNGHHPYTPGEN